jgi:nickel-dependent lactate racemase
MRVRLTYGREQLDVEVRDASLVSVQRHSEAPPLTDPAAAVRDALEHPLGFPALRRALTPDDHVTVIVDDRLPRLVELIVPVLEHIEQAGVVASAITLLCPASGTGQEWLEQLPDAFEDVHCEVHDPGNRNQLAYLATTRQGRRLYLNRTAVDADQLVVLSGRGYDPLLGYSGAEASLYPALSDEATLQELGAQLSTNAPTATPWPVRKEAIEVAWLLGAPFFVQVIPGSAEDIVHVVGGPADTSAEGVRLLDARWKLTVAEPASTVVASLAGDPARHDFADLARAAACAARVVRPDGRIILLSAAAPTLRPAEALLRRAEAPVEALALLRKENPPNKAAAFQWASAASKAKLYLLSGIPTETVEELFAVPLEHASQPTRMLGENGTYVFLQDAHKMLAVCA